MIASVKKYTTKASAIRWAKQLPKIYSIEKIASYLSVEHKYLVWTEADGLV